MVVDFDLEGQRFTSLNGRPHFKSNEAVSLVVHGHSQEELDYYWDQGPLRPVLAGRADRVTALLADRDPETGRRAMAAALKMKKIDVAEVISPCVTPSRHLPSA
jgi:predicted 3-demethylubiquinone-9 3-methyltransferase (glyoxalase superfamily)